MAWTSRLSGYKFLNNRRPTGGLDCARFSRDCGGLGAIVSAEFFVDSPEMRLDGVLSQEQIAGDRLVGSPFPQKPQDLYLAICQLKCDTRRIAGRDLLR